MLVVDLLFILQNSVINFNDSFKKQNQIKMLLLVGLTGGIGTGKSAVTNILRKKNYAVIDTDKIARAGY